MIKKLVPLFILLVTFAACSKDKFETKPTLTVKNQSRVVPADNEAIFFVTLEYTDKEGDLSGVRDSSIYYQAVLQNVRSVIGGPNYPPAFGSLPEFPEKRSGEIELRLDRFAYYKQIQNNQGGNDANDTIVFRIAVKDRAGNVSDTVTTEPIVLLGQ
ncbi:hypothetical protein L0U88_02655 [Flavihumibacter sp. RY-1]|uniref:Uncharacterized protein n=1 Tax=Flavihumibacter fluminis TaxID=2909236 RepID=A0ABS9BEN3_9BACT|nr:hypothetical protein [Flavihumibacter fluminis]MBU7578768.1 hypothetical protein [Flavihumibacter sp.]MCF1713528.1 hypothetical protein [Flavihumibacter fluminis]